LPRFDHLLPHPNFEDHQVGAGRRPVTFDETEEVWYGDRRFVPNRKRPGSFLMQGLTRAGRPVTVLVLPTPDSTTWLAYTAW
jgi:hypothetical protein